ncbi:cytochrome P450 [Xylariaceae sp. AK1471]|nr:cytochrome P450 [Xylariaceae sp. AK1471]
MAISLLLLSWLPTLGVVGYLGYLFLYRRFLDPLAKVPGPKLASLTSWYECYYDVVLPAQYVFKIKELHQQYGPVVRIGPDEVSVADPEFIDTIYAPGVGHKRDKDHKNHKALGVGTSIGGSRTHDLHQRRREPLNPFFSPQRINRLDAVLTTKCAQVEGHFDDAKASGEVLNLSDIYFAFANDIAHQYCFNNSPNILDDLPLASVRRTNVDKVLKSVKVMRHFGWIRDLMQMLPLSISARTMPPGVRDMMTFRKSIRSEIDSILAHQPSPDDTPSIFTHLRDSADLPESEKSAERLEDEATLMIMAGTYSPMLSLVIAHYHLLTRPDFMSKLRSELATHRKSAAAATPAQLEQLPYLSAIIQEAHRLSFGLTGRNPRVCPDNVITYSGETATYAFPPGTSLSASTLLIHTDEIIFPEPWRFLPERWLIADQAVLARRRRCMLSFMRGPRVCIGRHLANAEMAVLVAAMARWDMRLFETTAQDVEFCHDYHVLCPRLGSKGVRVEVLGRYD